LIVEVEYYHKNGSIVVLENLVKAIRDEDGKIIGIHGVSRDITDRRAAEKALRERESRLRALFDQSSAGYFIYGPDLVVTECNQRISDIIGAPVSQIIGLDLHRLKDKEIVKGLVNALDGNVESYEGPYHSTLTGAIPWISSTASPLRGDDGTISGGLGAVIDISGIKKTRDALRDREERYFAIFDQSPVGIVIYSRDMLVTECNRQYAEMGNSTREKIIGLDLTKLRDRSVGPLLKETLGGKTLTYEGPYQATTSEKELWVNASASPLRDLDGSVIGGIIIVVDLTGHRRAEESRIESERRYRELFDNAHDMMFTVGMDMRVTSTNKRTQDVTGYTADEGLKLTMQDIVAPEYHDLVLSRVAEKLAGGKSTMYELEIMGKDGRRIPIELSTQLLYRNGRPDGIQGICRDITERRKTDERLRKSDEIYRAVFNQSPVGIFMYDANLKLTYANGRFADILDTTVEKMMGQDLKLLREQGVVPHLEEAMNGSVSTYEGPYHATTSEASRWIRFTVSPLRGPDGAVIAGIGFVIDESQRRDAETARRESEERYRGLFDNANDFIFTIGLDSKFTSFNKKALAVTGHTGESARGLGMADIIAPEYLQLAQAMMMKKLEEGKPTTYELEIVTTTGERVPLEVNTQLVLVDGKPVGVQGIGRDIRERRRMEDQIRASLRQKETLLREVHHRVKNNFQVITSLMSLQAANIDNRELHKYFEDAQSRIRSMALIHEKLYQAKDVSRIDLASYFQTIFNELHASFTDSRMDFEPVVEGDEIYLNIDQAIPCGLIINELLTNAYKYAFPPGWSGRGKISIAVRERGGEIEIDLIDNGVGIPESVGLDNTRSLGLSLVPMLTRQLSGSVELDRSSGTRFMIRFPKKEDNRKGAGHGLQPDGSSEE
jgi:PAS domain S-box-containing protein